MKIFKHETVFDTANRTMTFIIHPRLLIMINFKEYEIIIMKDNEVIDKECFKGEHFSLKDMEMILIQAHQACEKLSRV